jgi:hypothetical protein
MKDIKLITTQEEARNEAITWQHDYADKSYSYAELSEFGAYFYKLGKKFGLVREFKENGII